MMRARRWFRAERSSPSWGSPRPDARPGRIRARPLLLPSAFALLLGALCLFPAAPAAAQDIELVSNLGQTRSGTFSTNGSITAQGFTTGSNAGGYWLFRIRSGIESNPTDAQIATVRAELWSAAEGGGPGSKVADLVVPHRMPAGIQWFDAPDSTVLSPNTTYFFVPYTTGNYDLQVSGAASTDEDSSGQTGWSISDTPYSQSGNLPGTSWTGSTASGPMRLHVDGQARAAPAGVIWSARLDVNDLRIQGEGMGCANRQAFGKCSTSLTGDDFTHDGTEYHIARVILSPFLNDLYVALDKAWSTDWVLYVGTVPFAVADGSITNSGTLAYWTATSLQWSRADRVYLTLAGPTDPPGPPVGLAVTPASTRLDLAWTAPVAAVTGYDMHYTSSTSVDGNAPVGSDVAAGWVDSNHTGTTASQSITGLTNDTAYRVRVRAVNSAGLSAWAWGTGTPKATTSGSTDASLSGLALADLNGAVSLVPAFSSTTYAYAADSQAWVTSATVTPTVNESNATVKVNGTTVASGSASGAIDLSFGANRIMVEVTAQAGNTRNYAITVTRALPTVSWDMASGSKPEDETFERTLEPVSNDMVGTVTYAAGTASLTDDVGSGRSTGFTMSAEDVKTSTISVPFTDDALNEENETFTITIEPGTGYTVGSPNVLTVTIVDNDPPAAPGGFAVAVGDGELTASWTKPDGPVTGYQARWKETAAPDSDATGDGTDPSTGWVVGGSVSSSSLSQMITGLTNDTSYDVQVRATDGQTATGNGYGPWSATKAGTPEAKTYGFTQAGWVEAPGTRVPLGITLSEAAPTGGLALTITRLLGTSVPTGVCDGETLATAEDIGQNAPTSFTVGAGSTVENVVYPLADNGDDLVGGGECFALQLGTSATGWTAASAVAKMTISRTEARIAMGSNAAATAKYTATVAETVTGGTLNVPVTVDHLPNESTTFTVAVLSGGTATEGSDFSIGTKTVTFGPSTQKTQNLAVTITNDAAVEGSETIELGIAAAAQGDETLNPDYTRDANGRLAQITITSEDAVPAAVTGLTVAAGNARLDLSWTAPADTGSAALSGYDVHYTSAPSTGNGAVGDDAPASGNDASAAWVAVTRTGTTATQAITSLTNDDEYRVRVRAVNAVGAGPWVRRTGTPGVKTYGFNAAAFTGAPGTSIRPSIQLSEAAPSGGLVLTITRLLGTSVPTGVCDGETLATAADIGANPPTSYTMDAGVTAEQFGYPLADNGDDLVGGGECFALRLGTSTTGWSAASAVAKMTVSRTEARIAMGSGAGATAKYTATVAETVTGGTLSVPVTVDYLPNASTTFTIAVLSGGTATEGSDFSIGTKTVTFGPSTQKTQNLAVTITNDAAVESSETIELGIVASTTSPNSLYTRHAQGRLAQITITSEDAVPGSVTNLDVARGDTKLDLTWTAPASTGSSALTGYDVHYTSATASAVPNNDPASGSDPAAGWVAITRSGTTASQSITGLTNDTAHRVRVRAVNASGGGAWEFGAGTPAPGPSPNANLSALTATWSSGSGYTSLALAPAFAEGTTAYTATAPNAATHVKVRPTVAHTAASVTVNGATVTSGQESAAIALGTTGSMIWIQVTAEDATTKDYSVAVARRPAVTLAASPNPVPEGSDLTVTATLSAALDADVTIPLSFTTGTAESGDFGALASITITGGATSGTGTVTTARDDDSDDETFTVALGASLPSSVEAGTPSSVEVTIGDVPSVSLEASPVEVEEGERVTVTARLSRAIASTVMIPLTTTRGTSEPGDHGTLAGILISSGATSGAATISTREDDDLEDETFTVAVRGEALPSPLVPGSPTSVEVFIVDIDTLSITLTSSTLRPSEGSTARLTATLSHPAPEGGVTVQFTANGSGDNPAAPVLDYTLDPPSEAQNATAAITIAEGQRTARATLRVVNDTEPEDDEGIQVGIATETVLGDKLPEPLELTIPANDGGGGSTAVAWLDAVPNPVEEGREVEIDVWLSQALDADARVPLTVTRGTSEEGDHGTLDEVVVSAGSTRGTGTISTARDDDADDETFTVRLGSPLPAGVRAGTPSRIEVEIADLDQPRVGLEVDPDVVPEGDPVTVTAVLTAPLGRAVTIPVATVRGTSESGDHGTLRSIRIASGDTEGTGRITTRVDSDTDDETFSVVLGDNLPDGVAAGFPDSVEVLITDETPTDDADVSLTAEPLEVPEGESVTVTATLEKALTRTVTIPVAVRRGTSESGDHGSLSGIRIASGQTEGTGTVTTSVDTDTDDETFSVVLRANQPSGVSVGYPDSVEITIADRGGAAPGRVRDLRVTAGNERLDLTWSPPSSGTVDVYQGEYKERSASEWTAIYESGGNYADTEATLQGANGTTYDVRVRASNAYGVGPWATGSGTPTAGGGSSDLRSLSVRVSATTDGSYRSVSLSPSFRSSVTAYKTTAPVGTKYAKFRPTSRTAVDLILVGGHEVASGAESPAVAVHHGVPVWISVLPTGDGPVKEYTVTFTIPSASADAGRSVTSAVDAALAVVGELSQEHAAGALLGERNLADERLEALDRLGNANGRYDVGDLLAWIERCRAGGAATCGQAPQTMPPASDAALPGAVGTAANRPRRRAPGRGRRPKRRRLRGLAVLLAAALWSCDGVDLVGPPTAADLPEPGTLAVAWTATAGGPAAAGALVEIDGPHVGDARVAGGLELYAGEGTNGPRRFVLAGDMRNGPVLEFEVPDRRQAGLYSVRVVEVAGADHRLLDANGYRTAVTR